MGRCCLEAIWAPRLLVLKCSAEQGVLAASPVHQLHGSARHKTGVQ